MHTTSYLLFFVYALLVVFETQAQQPPNVLLIITDDQGYGDLGYHGNPQIRTPNLDRLAAESVRFRNFYVSPVCAPTRASLMTGRYNIRTGVYDTYCGGAVMAAEEMTMAEIFAQAGYTTGQFGKWHLGDNYPFRPQDQGFGTAVRHQSGGLAQVGDVPNYHRRDSAYFDPILWKNDRVYQSKGYCTDVFTDEAIGFIRANKDRPFLAYVAYNAPHTPLQVPEKYYDQYRNMTVDTSYFQGQGQYIHTITDNHQEDARRVFAMVTNIDDNVQRLLDELQDQGVAENTIVIFMTDNGPQQYRFVGGYRGTKSMVREGGIHVPFYLKLPKGLARVKEVTQAAAHIDVLPTLAALCSITLPADLQLDGQNLRPFLENAATAPLNRTLFFEWQRSFPELYRNMAALKNGFKLIGITDRDAPIEAFELYDLNEDPYEAHNLIKEKPQIAHELKAEMEIWYEDIMSSPHINEPQRVVIGSPHENPSQLNRNDARGLQIIWAQEDVHVSWDVTVAQAGQYRVVVHFMDQLPAAGKFFLRIGSRMFTFDNDAIDTDHLVYRRIELLPGDATIDGWYTAKGGKILTPFYLEVERLEE